LLGVWALSVKRFRHSPKTKSTFFIFDIFKL
jgi:hypothetical protein